MTAGADGSVRDVMMYLPPGVLVAMRVRIMMMTTEYISGPRRTFIHHLNREATARWNSKYNFSTTHLDGDAACDGILLIKSCACACSYSPARPYFEISSVVLVLAYSLSH